MDKDVIFRDDALQALISCDEVKGHAYKMMEEAILSIPPAGTDLFRTFCGVPIEEAIDVMRMYSKGELIHVPRKTV